MLDLEFQVEGAEPERVAAAPADAVQATGHGMWRTFETCGPNAHSGRGAVLPDRIEPARRRYGAGEQERLVDLFGTPERWGQTLRPLLWTHASTVVRAFAGSTVVDLPVPCSYDFSLAATKYFDALEGGEIPLCFLFSGTIFHEAEERGLQVAQIPWEKEAYCRLPASAWRALMDLYYPNSAWLCLRKDVFDRLSAYKSRRGLPSWEQTVETLLAAEKELAAP